MAHPAIWVLCMSTLRWLCWNDILCSPKRYWWNQKRHMVVFTLIRPELASNVWGKLWKENSIPRNGAAYYRKRAEFDVEPLHERDLWNMASPYFTNYCHWHIADRFASPSKHMHGSQVLLLVWLVKRQSEWDTMISCWKYLLPCCKFDEILLVFTCFHHPSLPWDGRGYVGVNLLKAQVTGG